MQDTKVVTILKKLPAKEIKRLRKLVYSPFFNENQRVQRLFDQLTKYAPHFGHPNLHREQIYPFIFPNDAYDDSRLRRVTNKLLKVVEQYIQLASLEGSPLIAIKRKLAAQMDLLSFYEHHQMTVYFQQTLQNAYKLWAKLPYEDAHYYHYALLLAQQSRVSLFLQGADNRTPKINQSLDTLARQASLYFLYQQLKTACSLANHQLTIAFDSDLLGLKGIETWLAAHDLDQQPVIQMYFAAMQFLKNQEQEAAFHQLKNLLKKAGNRLSHEDATALYTFAKNYCAHKINGGNETYLQQIFELHQDELDKLVLEKGLPIKGGTFKNMVTIGLRLEAFEWVEDFLKNFKSRLNVPNPDDVIRYNQAQLHFYKKQYSETITLLFQSEMQDLFYKIAAKILLLQVYHEQDEIDARDNLINSLRVFIHYKKKLIHPLHVEKYRHFLNFLTAISKLLPREKAKAQKLRQQIEHTAAVAEKRWLLGQL